ncbi:MAG: hypothetical protein WAU02_03465 [Candidatus Saccharimonadales bacterium]
MELQRYQWVGLLAGVPLFSGAWLSAFYHSFWWGIGGLVVTAWGLYVANQVERRANNQVQAQRGIVAGLLAGVTARFLGYVAAALSGIDATVMWKSVKDAFRVVLAGDWLATVLLLVLVCGLGAFMAVLEPDAKKPAKARKA